MEREAEGWNEEEERGGKGIGRGREGKGGEEGRKKGKKEAVAFFFLPLRAIFY